jgi:hypothetical protein
VEFSAPCYNMNPAPKRYSRDFAFAYPQTKGVPA